MGVQYAYLGVPLTYMQDLTYLVNELRNINNNLARLVSAVDDIKREIRNK